MVESGLGRRSLRFLRAVIAAGLFTMVAACGYRLGPVPGGDPAVSGSVAVPLFDNASLAPRVENLFTEAFRERVRSASCLTLVPRGESEAVLEGTVVSLESYPIAVDKDFVAVEYGMRVVLDLSLRRVRDGEILWRGEGLEGEVRYYASSDPLLLKDNREEAMRRLARRVSRRVMDRILLGF